jgi:hypothetical protein
MADAANEQPNQPSPPEKPSARPAPPSYRPDKDLIGYIEKGQNPPKEERQR